MFFITGHLERNNAPPLVMELNTHTHTCMYVYRFHVYMCVCVYMHIYVQVHTHVCVHTHTYIYIPPCPPSIVPEMPNCCLAHKVTVFWCGKHSVLKVQKIDFVSSNLEWISFQGTCSVWFTGDHCTNQNTS